MATNEEKEKKSKYLYFEMSLEGIINNHGIDNVLGIPDYILARYLVRCLENLADLQEMVKRHHTE